ncbi:MAG: FkbM family methyltransferase [Bacteroidetes bacterium]|nr:FkbM family methyltransferase [Bacteroidota bacterium]
MDFLKIDVEGFEFNVLKGAANSCKKFRPVLFIEVNSLNLPDRSDIKRFN